MYIQALILANLELLDIDINVENLSLSWNTFLCDEYTTNPSGRNETCNSKGSPDEMLSELDKLEPYSEIEEIADTKPIEVTPISKIRINAANTEYDMIEPELENLDREFRVVSPTLEEVEQARQEVEPCAEVESELDELEPYSETESEPEEEPKRKLLSEEQAYQLLFYFFVLIFSALFLHFFKKKSNYKVSLDLTKLTFQVKSPLYLTNLNQEGSIAENGALAVFLAKDSSSNNLIDFCFHNLRHKSYIYELRSVSKPHEFSPIKGSFCALTNLKNLELPIGFYELAIWDKSRENKNLLNIAVLNPSMFA